MDSYHFEATDFALSDEGIHLLRSRYSFQVIHYDKIEKATIKKGAEINNVILAYLLGALLLAFAVGQTIQLIDTFQDPNTRSIYIETLILPLLPGLVGLYLLYAATKKGPMLMVESGNRKKNLRLREFERRGNSGDFKNYLSGKLGDKLLIYNNFG